MASAFRGNQFPDQRRCCCTELPDLHAAASNDGWICRVRHVPGKMDPAAGMQYKWRSVQVCTRQKVPQRSRHQCVINIPRFCSLSSCLTPPLIFPIASSQLSPTRRMKSVRLENVNKPSPSWAHLFDIMEHTWGGHEMTK
jgi:hypothetical protein